MKRIKVFLFRHKITSVFFAALLLMPLVYASFTFAKTNVKEDRIVVATAESKDSFCGWYYKRVYFNDAAHTTQVGVRVFQCDGGIGTAGTVTQYYDEFFCDCEEGE